MGFVAIVKGVSASGKSSRVFQLLKFFESIGAKLEDFPYQIGNKTRIVGVLVKELDIVFIGKIYKSGDIERWQGYDAVTGCFEKSDNFSNFIRDNRDRYSFVIEGAGVTGTNRLRPLFLREYCGVDDIFIKYYNFKETEKQEYLDRIMQRSGKLPGKGTMWDKVKGFENDFSKSIEDIEKLGDSSIFVEYGHYTDPIEDFGICLLSFMNMEDEMINGFIDFVEKFDYVNKNKFENFQQ